MRKEQEPRRNGYSPIRTVLILTALMGASMVGVYYTEDLYQQAVQEAQVERLEELGDLEAFMVPQQFVDVEPPPLELSAPEGVQEEVEVNEGYLRQMEAQFVTEVNAWRESQGLPAFQARLTVLDSAAEIQSQFISETNPNPLTHNTDFGWLSNKFPTEVQVLEITDDSLIRTRDRVGVASLRETGTTAENYAANGGVTETLVRGATTAKAALEAFLFSDPHRMALSGEDYIHIGVSAQVDENGGITMDAVLGRGGNGYDWPENTYIPPADTTGLDNHVYLPLVTK